jgi:hypothetical protein
VRTSSVGSTTWSVGLKVDWMDQIIPYPFGLSDLFGSLDQDLMAMI